MVTSAEGFPFDANCVTVGPATIVERLQNHTSEYITRVRTNAKSAYTLRNVRLSVRSSVRMSSARFHCKDLCEI
jgi:hypothetical protein